MSDESVRKRSVSPLGRLGEARRACSVASSLFDAPCSCIRAGRVVAYRSGLRSITEIPAKAVSPNPRPRREGGHARFGAPGWSSAAGRPQLVGWIGCQRSKSGVRRFSQCHAS